MRGGGAAAHFSIAARAERDQSLAADPSACRICSTLLPAKHSLICGSCPVMPSAADTASCQAPRNSLRANYLRTTCLHHRGITGNSRQDAKGISELIIGIPGP